MTDQVVIDAETVQVVALYPPRADAIMTLLTEDSSLPGVQTMLYSVQKSLKTLLYPPELVVLVTPNVSKETRDALCPTLCTRVIEVSRIDFPETALDKKVSRHNNAAAVSWDDHGFGLTKLHIFRLDVYDVIVYLELDCLVLQDMSELIQRGKIYQISEALVAAAPDILPPDKFNSGVMVLRPNTTVFDQMMKQRSLLTTHDHSDTGFLNAFFPEWFTQMPPTSRLPFHYNAQRILREWTYPTHPNYWDVAVKDLHIVKYTGTPKPWTNQSVVPSETKHVQELDTLWKQWYRKSQNFVIRQKELQKEERKRKEAAAAAAATVGERKKDITPMEAHRLVSKKYNQLRKQGYDVKEAMAMARSQYGQDGPEVPAGAQVASMFGFAP